MPEWKAVFYMSACEKINIKDRAKAASRSCTIALVAILFACVFVVSFQAQTVQVESSSAPAPTATLIRRPSPTPISSKPSANSSSQFGVNRAPKGNNTWTSVGPGGGDIHALAIDPQTQSTLYAGTLFGMFKSTDSGSSWTAINTGLTEQNVQKIALGSQNPNILLASTVGFTSSNHLFKSTDKGASWSALDYGSNSYISALEIDPQNSYIIYVATSTNGPYKSEDGGDTWTSLSGNGLTETSIGCLTVDAQAPNILYAGSNNGIFKSTNHGDTWSQLNIGFTSLTACPLAIDPQNSSKIYAAVGRYGIIASADQGDHWGSPHCFGQFCNAYANSIVIDYETPARIYVGTDDHHFGIYKSSDGNLSWSPVFDLNGLDVYAMAIDSQNAVYAGTDGSGIFKTWDGGSTWSNENNGLNITSIGAIAFDPRTPGTAYAGLTCWGSGCFAGGVFKTINNGLNWDAINDGLLANNIASLANSPWNPSMLYAGSDINGSGIFSSTNGGTNWTFISRGLDHYPFAGIGVLALTIDPDAPSTIYAGTYLLGIYKSTDGGVTWNHASDGLLSNIVSSIAIDPSNPSTIYAGTGYVRNNAGGDGVYKSTNGGMSWARSSTSAAVSALAIDQQNSDIIYAGVGGGILKSIDAGGSWMAILGGYDVRAIAIDPQSSNRVYAGAYGGGVLISQDSGANWNSLNDRLTNINVSALAIDPYFPNSIYIGTDGGGVFRIDLTLPFGALTAPASNSSTGTALIQLVANAWESDTSASIKQVQFNVFYDGSWRTIDVVATSPYQTTWDTPADLRSQILKFGINVVDSAGNVAYNAGGIVQVNFKESLGNPSVLENWIPSRWYLNQRTLTDDIDSGDNKCSVASMAMLLAANGLIPRCDSCMAAVANEMYPSVLDNSGIATIGKMRDVLRQNGLTSDYISASADAAWGAIKQEVDAARPVIIRTAGHVMTLEGHFFVAVGYRYTITNRLVIAYDPYGHWQGTCCQNNYDKNKNTVYSASHKGRWVYYDFDAVFGSSNYIITARPNASPSLPRRTASPITPPDAESDEPLDLGTYFGVKISIGFPLYFPLIRR